MSEGLSRTRKRRRVSEKVKAEPAPAELLVKRWTVEDKKNLLKALEKYGHTDIANICKAMRNKSPSSVKLFIHKMGQKARTMKMQNRCGGDGCTALETWLESGMFNDKSIPVPQALKFLSLFEKHPSPRESDGFDFRAAYEYLYRKTTGFSGPEVPEETAAQLERLVAQTQQGVWPSAEKEVAGYLATMEGKRRALKCYPPINKLESRRIIGPD